MDPFCASSYLTYRYVIEPGRHWNASVEAPYPAVDALDQVDVRTAADIVRQLRARVSTLDPARTGLLLSGGIDSAILAALAPAGTRSYTIRFVAPGAVRDESPAAARYATECALPHRIVSVTWADYQAVMGPLMRCKRAPLHAVEVGLHTAALAAKGDGLDALITGIGADSTFGGLDRLLSRDWTFDELVTRYTFLPPSAVLREPRNVSVGFERFRTGDDAIDLHGFLKETHGYGIIQAFHNALHSAGCRMIAPYEALRLAAPLDIPRIRAGESKYLLREVFQELFPDWKIPSKIAFARPMDSWLADFATPSSAIFRSDVDYNALTAEQRWLVYCLDRFATLLDTL